MSVLIFSGMQAYSQNIENQVIASEYGQYRVAGSTIGGFQFPVAACQVSGGGKNFSAFAAGTPVKIVDGNPAHTEIATPSSVYINVCAINMSTSYTHYPPYYLTSGTGGLQEAITANQTNNGINSIILDSNWYLQVAPANPATVIATVKGIAQLGLVDVTTTPYTFYTWNGTNYSASYAGGSSSGTTVYTPILSVPSKIILLVPNQSLVLD